MSEDDQELLDFRNKNFAGMSRINRAERVAEAAVLDKKALEAEVLRLQAELKQARLELDFVWRQGSDPYDGPF